MRVLITTPYLGINGAETSLVRLINYLNQQSGIELMLVSRYSGELRSDISPEIKCVCLDTEMARIKSRIRSRIFKEHSTIVHLLEKTSKKFNPDLWVINSSVIPVFMEAAIKCKSQVILYAHELEGRMSKLNQSYLAKLSTYPTCVLCSSELVERFHKQNGARKTQVMYPCVNLEELGKTEDGIKSDNCLWVSAGNLDVNKDPELFVDIAHKAIQKNPRLRFHWIGGDIDSQIGKKVNAKVKSLGLTSNVEISGWRSDYVNVLSSAYGYVCTSQEESLGISPIEAAVLGKHVVSTRCGGPEVALKDYASFAESRDSKELADLIVDRSLSPTTLPEFDSEKFSVEYMSKCFLNVLGQYAIRE